MQRNKLKMRLLRPRQLSRNGISNEMHINSFTCIVWNNFVDFGSVWWPLKSARAVVVHINWPGDAPLISPRCKLRHVRKYQSLEFDSSNANSGRPDRIIIFIYPFIIARHLRFRFSTPLEQRSTKDFNVFLFFISSWKWDAMLWWNRLYEHHTWMVPPDPSAIEFISAAA